MKMAPPAGVEPTTYRLGGGSFYSSQAIESDEDSVRSRPIMLRMRKLYKSLISKVAAFRFGRPRVPQNQADRDASRVYRGMWLVIGLLATGVIGCGVSAVYLIATGHWWALGPLALLGAVVWGTRYLFRLYDEPPV